VERARNVSHRARKGHKTVNRNKPNKPIDERENGRELATGYGR